MSILSLRSTNEVAGGNSIGGLMGIYEWVLGSVYSGNSSGS